MAPASSSMAAVDSASRVKAPLVSRSFSAAMRSQSKTVAFDLLNENSAFVSARTTALSGSYAAPGGNILLSESLPVARFGTSGTNEQQNAASRLIYKSLKPASKEGKTSFAWDK